VSGLSTKRLLIIAGSDNSGGAGIQADIKTASAHGVYAMTAITAVTVQDTMGVHGVHPVPPDVVRGQILACLNDIGADAIKIGMLASDAIANAVAGALAGFPGIPLVIDPVLASTGGAVLLGPDALKTLKTRLFPLSALVTPNIPETESLTGIRLETFDDMRIAADEFAGFGVPHVLFKGGHAAGPTVSDALVDTASGHITRFESPRIDTAHTHGTGCTLAAAIACGLAQELSLIEAVQRAHAYVQEAIRTAPGLGRGNGPVNHLR
jgi:hydroxymethylpyrimidine/phosphomethylpyrimidine kinase